MPPSTSVPPPPLMDDSISTGSPIDPIPRLHALVTPITTTSSLVFNLNTLITIPDFTRFYHSDPASFEPIYYALSDGSLVAPPFLSDIRASNVSLIIIAFLLTVFARNICTSATFILCGKVRKKCLFYTVFVSQLLALPALIPLLAAQFQRVISCKAVMSLVVASTGISLSLLITGILGVKAYRCLDNSRVVLVVLLTLRTAALVFLASDLASLRSHRSLSGRCYRTTDTFSSAFIILLLIESLFVCFCFLYTVWKSHGSVAARGRIAISLSLDDIADPPVESRTQSMETSHSRRGWWDYVSTADPSASFSHRSRRTESVGSHDPSVLTGNRDGVKRFSAGERVSHAKNTVSSMMPTPPLPLDHNSSSRTSSLRMSTVIQAFPNPRRENSLPISRRPCSPALSSMSHMSRYMPRVAVFKEVMRDELFYTTFITAFTAVSVVMTLVGIHDGGEIENICWIGFDWVFISCLVMHSFGRVIRRHDNEALLQQPSAWHHNLYTDQSSAELLGEGRTRATRSVFGRTSQARTRRSALTTRQHDVAHPSCDSCTRHLFPPISCGSDTRSATASSNMLSPLHEVESFTGAHVSIPIDEITHHPHSSGRDSPSRHRSDLPFRHDISLPSLPYIYPPGDQR